MSLLSQAQVNPALQREELPPREGAPAEVFETVETVDSQVSNPVEHQRRTGKIALTAKTMTEAEQRSLIETRLPSHNRPERNLSVNATNTTDQTHNPDHTSSTGPDNTTTANCTNPGVWPATTRARARRRTEFLTSSCGPSFVRPHRSAG